MKGGWRLLGAAAAVAVGGGFVALLAVAGWLLGEALAEMNDVEAGESE